MKKIFLIALLFFIASVAAAPIEIKFFFQEGCPDCAEVEGVLQTIQARYGHTVVIERISILSSSGFEQFKAYGFEYTPALVIGDRLLQSKEQMTFENLSSILDGIIYGFPFRLTPLLSFILGIVSSLSPAMMGVMQTLLVTLSRRRRTFREALTKSSLFLFFFTFLLLLTTTICAILDALASRHTYYVSVLLLFFVASCALVILNNALSLINPPFDFSRYRIRRIKTMIPRGAAQAVSLSLYIFGSGLLVMVPAFCVVVADGFFSGNILESLGNVLVFSGGFFASSLLITLAGSFIDVVGWISESKGYSLLFSAVSALLLLAYGGIILNYILTLRASYVGMVFAFVMTVLFLASLGWVVGRWRK